jgi:hypothetical protein
MNAMRKVVLLFLIAVVCALSQPLLSAEKAEPEIAHALEASSSLEEFTRWISELSGETDAIIRGRPYPILTRYAYAQNAETVEDYLRNQFHSLGLEVESHTAYTWLSNNVIGRIVGISKPLDVVIVCAHYDSISGDPYNIAPGADDNASGVAAVLTAASILRNFRFERTVEFCLFTGEELGLLGSDIYAEDCLASGKNVVGVFNMDMIIHPTDDRYPDLPLDADVLADGASEKLATLLRASIHQYTALDVELHSDTTPASDHASFWNIGAQAIVISGNTPTEGWSGASTVYHTVNDRIDQVNVNLPFGLSVAKGVAAAAMSLAEWEPSSSLPVGTTTVAEIDGFLYYDADPYHATLSIPDASDPDLNIAGCCADNLVLQGTARAVSKVAKETVSHSNAFQTFIPHSTTVPEGEEIALELTMQGSGQWAIEGKLAGLYASCRVEVWARSIDSSSLFDGSVSLSSAGMDVSGDFSSDAFVFESTKLRRQTTLSPWTRTVPFHAKIGQPITLRAHLTQLAYASSGSSGVGEAAWTDPLRLTVISTTPGVSLIVAGFAEQPRISGISADPTHLTLTWQPFCQGSYTVERSDDLISWTPVATTPFCIWRSDDLLSAPGFFRVRSE